MMAKLMTGAFVLAILVSGAWAMNTKDQAIQDIFILSDIEQGQIEIRVWLDKDVVGSFRDATADITIEYPDGSKRTNSKIKFTPAGDKPYSSLVVDIYPVVLWHPRTPHLYGLEMIFRDAEGSWLASATQRFGMRKFETRNARFYINNQPFYFRACGHEPEKFLEKLDRKGIEKRLRQVKRYGFNAVRHHSHVPSDTYLDVADEVGLLIQMEIGGKIGTDPGSEKFLGSKNDWVSMIKRGRRHPCTFIYSMGNEIYGNDPGLIECQNILYDLAKEMDPSVLVLNRSGSNPFNDAYGKYDLIERPIGEYEHVAEFAHEAFMLYLRGERKGRSDEFPIIAHEYPLVASYPNPALAAKYDEEPFWIKLAVENARKNGLEHLLPEFVRNSERIQALCRKEMLEEARKFRELDGYSMLRFTDCMERVSGVVDDFADPKNVTAEEFLRTNGETVLLCTWNGRSFWYGDRLEATLEISHHGSEPFSAKTCQWWLMSGPQVLAAGKFDKVAVGPVDVAEIGRITITIPELPKPAKLTLRAALPESPAYINNEWYFWAFPKETVKPEIQKQVVLWDPRKRMKTYLDAYPHFEYISDEAWRVLSAEERAKVSARAASAELIITDSWQEAFYDFLDKGGRIWIISDKSWPWPEEIGIFGLHITKFIPSDQAPPVFPELDEQCAKWLTICSNTEPRYGNSGTLIYPHPALGDFPHEGFCDLQFWPMIYRAKSLQLDRFPAGTEPVIRTIDNYYRGRSKGYMVELGVGRGKVFISTLNLTQSFPWAVATRYMFDQLLRYVTGPTAQELRTMIEDFKVELASREPLIHDEMPARYATRWKWLLSPYELIILPIYEAKGVDEDRLGVHYEYAQTQWYLSARPGDVLSWEFENKTNGDFSCTLQLASPQKDIPLSVQIDKRDAQAVAFQGSGAWEHFVPVECQIAGLDAGKHTLTLSVGDRMSTQPSPTVRIRDLELRANTLP
jgi:beta-galactosidase